MFSQNDNSNNSLKDGSNSLGVVIKDASKTISYTKTTNLITALYMVTDIMDRDEPMRNKLRTLGSDILSDIYSKPSNALRKIAEVMAFLDIAGIVGIVSDMNINILRKEFNMLRLSIQESLEVSESSYSDLDLNDLFAPTYSLPSESIQNEKRKIFKIMNPTRIGVQKGSTLLKALGSVSVNHPYSNTSMSDKNNSNGHIKSPTSGIDFEALKRQRRNEILSIIKNHVGGATITDIRSKAIGSLTTCSEKTLQRELVGMLKDNLLKKTGEKRWSRYFLS